MQIRLQTAARSIQSNLNSPDSVKKRAETQKKNRTLPHIIATHAKYEIWQDCFGTHDDELYTTEKDADKRKRIPIPRKLGDTTMNGGRGGDLSCVKGLVSKTGPVSLNNFEICHFLLLIWRRIIASTWRGFCHTEIKVQQNATCDFMKLGVAKTDLSEIGFW